MRTRVIPAVILVALVALASPSLAGQPDTRNFVAHLLGDEEVPPVDTQAQGQAIFQLNKARDELRFLLLVANIEDVTQAHIHVGPPEVNGPVVAWLYPPGPPAVLIPGRSNGILAQGTIIADNLVGPLSGMSLDDLIAEMQAGNTYANVHTAAHPPGEIRGQIAAAGP